MRFSARFAMVAGVIGVVAIGGLAFAYWTQSGSGSGTSTAGTTSAITVNQTGSPNGLVPGRPHGSTGGHVHEPESRVGQHQLRDRSGAHVCLAPGRRGQAGLHPGGLRHRWHVRSESSSPRARVVGSWSGLTVRLLDNGLNQDNCKNVSITIDYTANP